MCPFTLVWRVPQLLGGTEWKSWSGMNEAQYNTTLFFFVQSICFRNSAKQQKSSSLSHRSLSSELSQRCLAFISKSWNPNQREAPSLTPALQWVEVTQSLFSSCLHAAVDGLVQTTPIHKKQSERPHAIASETKLNAALHSPLHVLEEGEN